MKIRARIIVFGFLGIFQPAGAEENTVSKNLERLTHIVYPVMDYSAGVSLAELVDFAGSYWRHVNPASGETWKIDLVLPLEVKERRIKIHGRNVKLATILGKVADAADGTIVVTSTGFVIRQPSGKKSGDAGK